MGVDAKMFARVPRAVPDDEVRALRIALGDAFGAKKFWIFRGKNGGEAPLDDAYSEECGFDSGRHCIERVREFTQDGEKILPREGETLLRVYPASRYYGIGYERGDLPFLLALARFLRDKTGGEVWYGGDSSGICAQVLDQAYEAELWAHFVEHQHKPYRHAMSWDSGDGIPTAFCAFCNQAMHRYGSGNGGLFAPFSCEGCGADVETRDGGKTWTARKEVGGG